MSQTRYHNYQRPLNSFAENQRVVGVLNPGRQSGWDILTPVSGNLVSISHDTTGVVTADLAGTLKNKQGLVVSRQGVFVYEDAAIEVSVDFNGGNTNDRIDLLVMTHTHSETPGGALATYSVIKGSVSNAVVPALPNAAIQVIIGLIYIPAGATNHTTTLWEAADPIISGQFITEKVNELGLKTETSFIRSQATKTGHEEPGDFNRVVKSGLHIISTTLNRPNTSTGFWSVLVFSNGSRILQCATALVASGKSYTRVSTDSGITWSAWRALDLNGELAQEIADRIAGDSNLLTLLSNESAARVAADTALNNLINAEALARSTADIALGNRFGGLTFRTIDIGPWNMNTGSNDAIVVLTGITTWDKVRFCQAFIKPDDINYYQDFLAPSLSFTVDGAIYVGSVIGGQNQIQLIRRSGSGYDSAAYNDPSVNRGFVVVGFIA